MSKPMIPYAVQLAAAQTARNADAVDRIMQECFYGITKELLEVIHRYDPVDLPFVLASMRLTAQAMMPLLNESGQGFLENLMKHVSCVTVDMDELRRQAEGDDDGGETEQ